MPSQSILTRLRLGWGKLRRFYLHTLNRDYVRRNLARRRGECSRCGACCRLMFECSHLDDVGEISACVRHETRHMNCRAFPVDERDLADRDLVNGKAPCGYRFDPPRRPQRWIAVLLTAFAGIASPARETEGAGPERPRFFETGFRGDHLPSGWRTGSGSWKPGAGGLAFLAPGTISRLLRPDGLPIAEADFTIEVWASFARAEGRAGDAPSPALAVSCGGLVAGLACPDRRCAFARFVSSESEADVLTEAPAVGYVERGRFKLTVRLEAGLARVRARDGPEIVRRDVFGTSDGVPLREISVQAGQGAVVHAVRASFRPRRERPRVLRRADRRYRAGEIGRALDGYSSAADEDRLLPRERAEARYKLGLVLSRLGRAHEAARAWALASRLDPEGPWAERARLRLGRTAIERGEPALALRFARELVRGASPGIEDWWGLQELVGRAREDLVALGLGPQATWYLRGTAEGLEWAGARPGRVAWAWEEVARSYEARGLLAEARAARRRAKGFLSRA
jgi:tetratricopeptide (TPR) repeat protein